MKSKYGVSDAEWEVLKMLWRCDGGVRQSKLIELLNQEGMEWKRQTVNTFLARMEERGLVKRENHIVSAVYGEEEYANLRMRESIDILYGGKVSNFLTAFVRANEVRGEELEELRRLLSQSAE